MYPAPLQNSHALIPNANQYVLNKQYVSVHSEDRDATRFPNSAEFEIELPQDYTNVVSTRLSSWCFPSNDDVFSAAKNNLRMTFQLQELYAPADHGVDDAVSVGIFAALNAQPNHEYEVHIETGFYTPEQMAVELTNKFNEAVTAWILERFAADPDAHAAAGAAFTTYTRFQIAYSAVGMKLWFGNNADQFVITNETPRRSAAGHPGARGGGTLPDFSNWGLPAFLGFEQVNAVAGGAPAAAGAPQLHCNNGGSGGSGSDAAAVSLLTSEPRFFHDVHSATDGFWLAPSPLTGATPWFLAPPLKNNFMGRGFLYMEIDGMNCIDETSPWNMSAAAVRTNNTNGVVRSSFAKIPIPAAPVSQWFDDQHMAPYKYFSPPAERIRRLRLKLRYHDGEVANFGASKYSFMLEVSMLVPNQERRYSIMDSQTLTTINSGAAAAAGCR